MPNNPIAIKILSIAGGMLASIAFTGFLFIAGLADSEMAQLIFGVVLIAAAIGLNKQYETILLDTISISFYVIGGLLLGIGLGQFGVNGTVTCLLYCLIALVSLFYSQKYMVSLVSFLSIHGSLLGILLINEWYELIHLYIPFLSLTLLFVYAKKTSSESKTGKLYEPGRTAVTLSFLSSLFLPGTGYIVPLSPMLNWISSLFIIGCILFLVLRVLQSFNLEKKKQSTILLLVTLLLLPGLFAPSIAGAILVMLLAFSIYYRTGLVLGIISGIYFISQYYYDLGFSLLTKSILLMSSGVILLILYYFLHFKFKLNEK